MNLYCPEESPKTAACGSKKLHCLGIVPVLFPHILALTRGRAEIHGIYFAGTLLVPFAQKGNVYFMTFPAAPEPSKPSSQSWSSPFRLPQKLQRNSIVTARNLEVELRSKADTETARSRAH
jgi:hypothetical protein